MATCTPPPGGEAHAAAEAEAERERTIYVSGDNASLPLVEQIASRFPVIDIALLFAGGARVPEIDATLTLTSAEALRAAIMLGVSHVVGLHTDDWTHFTEGRDQLEAAFAGTPLLIPTPRGETVDL